ncbi:MAG TPA: amidohydrolase family protein [Solirubrobacteraceae bacterium]|jgi:predicted amidohydrolase YtcJ|nr:amidohydrolase family protein [Solirubrobacteraceae bacterium]
MRVARRPGAGAFARLVLGNLTASTFAPAAGPGDPTDGGEEPERTAILRGGTIVTMDPARPVGEALAIRGETILDVGPLSEVKRHYTAATEIIDLAGHAVLPGFVEPHVRVLESALAMAGVAEEQAARLCEERPEECAAHVESALAELAKRGCTTVYDVAIGRMAGATEHRLLEALARAPDAPVRVRGAFTPELAAELGARPGGDERYAVVGVSYAVDGPLEACAAAVGEPYLNGRGSGALLHEEHELREALRPWHEAGWQLVMRCDGDRATEQALRCLEALPSGTGGRVGDVRDGEGSAGGSAGRDADRLAVAVGVSHRIDHFAVVGDEQIARAAALGVGVSHPINQVYFQGESLRDEVLGPERAAHLHSLCRDLEHGLVSSCHSSHGAAPADPCLALRTATTRLMRGSDDVLGPFQQLTVEEALRTLTVNPARQMLLGDRVGALRPGMLADLVVLDRDPREVAPERLHELRVIETWLGGRRRRWV